MTEEFKVLRGRISGVTGYHTDAYMIAVKNGFEGTEAEWLASLKGKQGVQGIGSKITTKRLDASNYYIPGKTGVLITTETKDPATGQFSVTNTFLLDGENGKSGEDGITPHIQNGNWWIGSVDTGIPVHVSPCTPEEIEAMQQDIADLKYVAIDITSISNNVNTAEKGSTVTAVNITWKLNKDAIHQTIKNSLSADTVELAGNVRSCQWTGQITETIVLTLSAIDERGTAALESTSIYFWNGVYYGALAKGTEINSAAVLGLTRKLQSGKKLDFTVTPGAGERPVYALPTRYGTPTFKIGGFTYDWEKIATFDFTNASGYTESYDVWMHGQDVSESITINVT